MHLPQLKLSVLYCIKMWCMLCTPARSTRHSAIDSVSAEMVHCPPPADRSVYRPSTALSAPQEGTAQGCLCQVDFCKAMFSVERNRIHEKILRNRMRIFSTRYLNCSYTYSISIMIKPDQIVHQSMICVPTNNWSIGFKGNNSKIF